MMYAYLDLLTVSLMSLNTEGKSWWSFSRLIAGLCLTALIVLPIVAFSALLYRFEYYLSKTSKKSLGALLEKIDKH